MLMEDQEQQGECSDSQPEQTPGPEGSRRRERRTILVPLFTLLWRQCSVFLHQAFQTRGANVEQGPGGDADGACKFGPSRDKKNACHTNQGEHNRSDGEAASDKMVIRMSEKGGRRRVKKKRGRKPRTACYDQRVHWQIPLVNCSLALVFVALGLDHDAGFGTAIAIAGGASLLVNLGAFGIVMWHRLRQYRSLKR
jgi:hypothetical protein